jgi:hypothetical protein
MKRSIALVAVIAAALAAPAFAASPQKNATYIAFCGNTCTVVVHTSANGKTASVYTATTSLKCTVKVSGLKPIAITSGKIFFQGNVPATSGGRTITMTLDAKWTSSRTLKGTMRLAGKFCSGKTISFQGGLGQG